MSRSPAPLRLGTRGSRLALRQVELFREAWHGPVEVQVLDTQGDLDRTTPLTAFPGAGVFTDALDRALLDGTVDLAVHSCKDLPLELPRGLAIAAFLPRANPADVAVLRPGLAAADLGRGGLVVGTCSTRRTAQWLARHPTHVVRPLRGNVDARVAQVAEGRFDAIVLAAAGLDRLGLASEAHARLDWMLPAPAQAAIAIVARAGGLVARRLAAIDHAPTSLAVRAERAFAARLDPSGQAAVSALATFGAAGGELRWNVFAADGTSHLAGTATIDEPDAAALAARAARDAIRAGVDDLLTTYTLPRAATAG